MTTLKLGSLSIDVIRPKLRPGLFPAFYGHCSMRSKIAPMRLKRIGRMAGHLAIIVLLAGCTDAFSTNPHASSTTTVSTEKACPESARQFWTKFRGAALKEDMVALADMTEFPSVIYRYGGQNKLLSRQEFIKYFPQLLNAPVGDIHPPITPKPVSMKELARVVITPDGPFCAELPEQFDVGHWTFATRPQGWRLVSIGVYKLPSSMSHLPNQPSQIIKD